MSAPMTEEEVNELKAQWEKIEERLETSLEALYDYQSNNKQLWTAIERIRTALTAWEDAKVDAEDTIGEIDNILYPFFVEPDGEWRDKS